MTRVRGLTWLKIDVVVARYVLEQALREQELAACVLDGGRFVLDRG
jgi:hypothetical protein